MNQYLDEQISECEELWRRNDGSNLMSDAVPLRAGLVDLGPYYPMGSMINGC